MGQRVSGGGEPLPPHNSKVLVSILILGCCLRGQFLMFSLFRVSSRFSVFLPPSKNMPLVELGMLNFPHENEPSRVYSCLAPSVPGIGPDPLRP